MHARRGRPAELQRLELGREVQNAVLAYVERVVVKENLFHLGEVFKRLLDFPCHVVGRASPPGVPGKGLRPHAEGTKRRTSPGGIEGNKGMQQERDVIALDFQIALVDVRSERQGVELLGVELRPL